MKQKYFGLVAVCLTLMLCVGAFADTIDLSSVGYDHNIVAGPGDVIVIAFDYDTGGNDTTINFRRLNDDGGDSWMMPVDFTGTYIEVDSDYGPYRYNVSLSGVNSYVFMLDRSNGLWKMSLNGSPVDFVATSSTTNPQPDGTTVTDGVVVADKYFSDESAEAVQNAADLGWTANAGDGVGGTGAYKVKFPQASGSYIENLTVTPMPGMMMYYGFESVGATVTDGSGYGNDATVAGDVTGYIYGRSGADAVFGGTAADSLDVTATTQADRPSSAITIAAWCKVDDT
ncbi:MAG: hypothetical protein KAS96_02000, partial [Planctomycetes bacterium]|nr:hypothetical protein [Planctomycetota bacterium]